MQLPFGPFGGAEQPVERGDAVHLCRRDIDASGDLVDRAAADPADAVVQGVENWQQTVAPITKRVPATGYVMIGGISLCSMPGAIGLAEDGVDCRYLGVGCGV